MEFERALFRIHQRSLESEDLRAARLRAERLAPWAFAALLGFLSLVHPSYVGQARCLPEALERAGLWNTTSGAPALPEDAVLGVAVYPTGRGRNVSAGSGQRDVAAATLEALRESSAADPGSAATQTTSAPQGSGEAARQLYSFALESEVLTLKPRTLMSHGFRVHNISLSEECLVSSGMLRATRWVFEGLDGLVINELAFGLRSRGHLLRHGGGSSGEGESWAWSASQVEENPSHFLVLTRKVKLLLKSIVTVALMSAITGFFIRVAVNGSAVLMFVVAIASRHWDLHCAGTPSLQLLGRSFPWIGVHTGVLLGAGRPLWPLLRAHLVFLFVQSFAHLSCSLTWRLLVYERFTPQGFADQIFGLCSMLELFNLIYVRSAASASVFPKLSCACLVYLQFYSLCSLYPCHGLALATCTVACVWVMLYCLNNLEEPALRGDPFSHNTPTTAHPRALYLPQLSGSWSLEAAPLWTMFWPGDPAASYSPDAMRHMSDEEYLIA